MSNKVADKLKSLLLYSELEDAICHIGTPQMYDNDPHGSGRYRQGSGENPYQHDNYDLLGRIEMLHSKGMTDAQIAKELNIKGRNGEYSSGRVRAIKNILKTERDNLRIVEIEKMRERGISWRRIGEKLGIPETTCRHLMTEDRKNKENAAITTADYLEEVLTKEAPDGMLDVGKANEYYCNVSRTKFDNALYILEERGYKIWKGGIRQVTNKNQETHQMVLCTPDHEHKDIYQYDKIYHLEDSDLVLTDNGGNIRKWENPASLSSKRVSVVYGDEGGIEKDGLVEIRRGVKDVNIGDNHYAQVRIMVDGTHYIKGMAVYSDDLPDGIDVRFNTNKPKGTPMLGDKHNSVFKPIKTKKEGDKTVPDYENPFGALLRETGGQSYYDDPKGEYVDRETGKKQSLNKVNITRQEGDWAEWKDKLSAQFLSKQPIELARRQLKMAIDDKEVEYKEIMANTNPTVKRKLLREFADSCDSDAVTLYGAALPRQKYQVILPLKNIKETEVYAPGYRDGEQVALVRFPHEGIFQIPVLTVNNNNRDGIKTMGKGAKDAVGISSKVAEKLSGADFDGDTVLVIPTNNGRTKIAAKDTLDGLKDFDAKTAYPRVEGMKVMKDTQKQMGVISNLITDMTLQGASEDELARAVRHANCIIDAEKHELNWKRSEKENDIEGLKRKYQKNPDKKKGYGGAASLLSRSKGEYTVDRREGSPYINVKGTPGYDPNRPEGTLIYKTARDEKLYYTDPKTGKMKKRQTKSTNMAETDDARTLIGFGHPKEELYAEYANAMKGMANKARMDMVSTPKLEYSPSAAKAYEEEVKSLNRKLVASEKNQLRERHAQGIANVESKAYRKSLTEMGLPEKEIDKEMKKYDQRALTEARIKVGAKRVPIDPTDKEWEAIQSGAIHDSTLDKMLKYISDENIYNHTSGNKNGELSPWKIQKIKSMSNSDYTIEQIARSLGVSTSTVSKYL